MQRQISVTDGSPSVSVGVIVIATGRYCDFLPAFVAGAREYVAGLSRIFVLSDRRPDIPTAGDLVVWLPWGHIPWPYPTLLRYRAITAYADALRACDVLMYSDVDMRFAAPIDLRAADGTVAVLHPGYGRSDPCELPYERRPESTSHIPAGEGESYFAGGVQGGTAAAYLEACCTIAGWVQADLAHGVVPVWHDESAWNKYCWLHRPAQVLPTSYCSPEYWHDPQAVIVALDKNHDRYRGVKLATRALKRASRLAARVNSTLRRSVRRALPAKTQAQ